MTIRFLGAGKNGAGLTNQPQGLDVGIGSGGLGKSYASQFNSFDQFGSVTPSSAGTFVTLINVTGKGYLLEAYAMNCPELKITIDGSVYFWSYDSSSSCWVGILNVEGYKYNSSSFTKIAGNNIASIITSGSDNINVSLPQSARTAFTLTNIALPIFFNSSLKIEVTTYPNPTQVSFGIRGAYK